MADGRVDIETKLDTSGVEKGVNDLKKKLNDAGKTIDDASKKNKNLNNTLKDIKTSTAAAVVGYAGVAVAVKKTVDALNDCEAAYKIQRNAEIALQQAAKNNPYLNNESVYNLRNFASELQSMSNIGDEQSIQVMAQLAAMGRTEDEIQAIMKAAADMSAVTGNSLQNVAIQLNKTYSGLAGELGEANSAVRALTQEELKSGKAIDIIAQQYNGQAAAMADNTIQLANAWGDFKENIGRGWSRVTAPVKQFFTDILSDMNEALQLTADKKDAARAGAAGTETAAQAKLNYDEAVAALAKMDATPGLSERKGGLLAGTMVDTQWQTKRDAQAQKVADLKTRYEELAKAETDEAEAAKKAADEAAAAADKAAKAKSRDEAAADYIQKNKAALAERLASMELEAKLTGETVDAGEMYNAYMQSYIDLITKSNGLVTENNTAAKERLALLEQWADKAQHAADEEERLAYAQKMQDEATALLATVDGLGEGSIYDKYLAREQELLKLKRDVMAAEIEDAEKRKDAIEKIEKELADNRRELWAGVAREVNGYASQINDIINNAAKLALETDNNRMQAELDNLEIKYRKGELSEEEYQEKVAEAKRKGAEYQYKIEMAQWSSNLLTATANTAVGVTECLAQGGVAGIIMGALVAAAGAVQLASIMGAKPIKHFATGGVVGGMNGATMGADNTTIAARNGEMVLNASQQRALWDKLNGSRGAGGSDGVNVVINNSAANLVSAQPQITRGQIELMIDARVNDGLRNGRFDGGLNAANAGMSGEYYGL